MLALIWLVNVAFLVGGCSGQGKPSWQSEWVKLSSQAGTASFMELSHNLGQLPIKGKALVRPLTGANAGLSFEAIGSAQWDDDVNVRYCGVVFVYDETRARIGAPTTSNGKGKGRIFCAGSPGWSDGNGNAQDVQEAEVKVILWLEDSLPTPDVAIDWTPVDCKDSNAVYFEFANPIGEELDYVTIQVRVKDMSDVTWIAEGIGSDNSLNPISSIQQGGVVYSHDTNFIRFWIRKVEPSIYRGPNSVINVEDGWAFRTHTNHHIMAGTGDVRIFGWKSLGSQLFSEEMEINLDGNSAKPGEVSLGDIAWDPVTSIVSLQVIPSDGPNEGSVFYGTGVMPRGEINGWAYGGVQFGYSDSVVRLFYPVGADGCLVRLGPTAGAGQNTQCSRKARVRITIWGTSPVQSTTVLPPTVQPTTVQPTTVQPTTAQTTTVVPTTAQTTTVLPLGDNTCYKCSYSVGSVLFPNGNPNLSSLFNALMEDDNEDCLNNIKSATTQCGDQVPCVLMRFRVDIMFAGVNGEKETGTFEDRTVRGCSPLSMDELSGGCADISLYQDQFVNELRSLMLKLHTTTGVVNILDLQGYVCQHCCSNNSNTWYATPKELAVWYPMEY